MKTLLLVMCLVASSTWSQAGTGTNKRDAKLLSQVKQLPVSELDPLLPQLTFEKWLNIEAGADARLWWAVTNCAEQPGSTPEQRDLPLCVEVDAQMKDGRAITISIEVGTQHQPSTTKAKVVASRLITPGETVPIPRLSDLPLALVRTHRLAHYPEIAQ